MFFREIQDKEEKAPSQRKSQISEKGPDLNGKNQNVDSLK